MKAENVSKKRRLCDVSSSSSDVNISDDAIFCNVLPRLPIKSLMRFRSVSKSWCFEISSQLLADRHLRLSKEKEAGNLLLIILPDLIARQNHIFVATLNGSDKDPIRFKTVPVKQYDLRFTESINGLVCLYNWQTGDAYICNPTIGQLVPLPSVGDGSLFAGGHSDYAFGYEPEGKEYKVVRRFGWWSGHLSSENGFVDKIELEVLTLGTNSWRRLDNAVMATGGRYTVCVNGALHWPVSDHRIWVFDLKAEKFGTVIPMPRGIRSTWPQLIKINGCLCLADRNPMVPNQMELWILKDYQDRVWIQETITFPYSWRASAHLFPVGSVATGEILFIPRPQHPKESMEMHYYDMKRKFFRRDGSVINWRFLKADRFRSITICSQSLISFV